MSTALVTLTNTLAKRLDMGDGSGLIETLKATAFKGQVTDAQMTALMVVANQYGLNPWTKEIYAFPDKQNGIVPVVGVDGWARIINGNDQFDGIEFEQDDDSCTCVIYRKDRTRPIKVTEYMSECRRKGFGPWESHPKRMLRHKAMIQCARLAFGFGGIYDQDEADRIIEKDITQQVQIVREFYPEDKFNKLFPAWQELIESGKKSAMDIIATASTANPLTTHQEDRLMALKVSPVAPPEVIANIREKAENAGISDQDICKQLRVKSLDSISMKLVDSALVFIANPMGE